MATRVVIVTGASRGIGLAISKFLLAPPQSCNLVVIARGRQPLEDLKKEANDHVQVLSGDLTDMSMGKKAVDLAISTWGRLDGLVINHGQIEPVEKVADANIEEWRKSFDINTFSYIAMVTAAIPALRNSKGRIIMTSSGAAVKATNTWGCYGAAKAVINHLAKTLAKEELDITTMAIRPGVVDTEMQRVIADQHFKVMDKDDAERFRQLKAQGKMLKPEQPGHVMARLVVEAPKELTGEFLNWDDSKLSAFQGSTNNLMV